MLLEGVHFDLNKATIKQVGYKAMAVNLSDCAAMATIPVAAVVSVALPKGFGSEELKQLHAGITFAGRKFGCELVGGDITAWHSDHHFVVNVAMISKQAANKPVRRSGAQPGDIICVTGSLGGSLAGKHLRFVPRVKEALKIAHRVKLHSMMDLSDGLSSDLPRICRLSSVGAIVEANRIPISVQAHKSRDPLGSALNDGEDFELLFTLSQEECERLLKKWDEPVPITQVGTITNNKKMQIKMPDGRLIPLQSKGYDHLRKENQTSKIKFQN
jgi:thiamine-monophosphate kinase